MDLSRVSLAERAGVTSGELDKLLSGHFEERTARKVSEVLNLNPACLAELANDPERPKTGLPEAVTLHNTAYPVPGYAEMTVNSYTVLEPGHPEEGILIDAGATLESMQKMQRTAGRGWRLFLTHSHPDHVVNLGELRHLITEFYAPAGEPVEGARPVNEGESFKCGGLLLKALETPGHSPGGMSYLLEGLALPVVFVGDALFCFSMGKVKENYEAALAAISKKILGLPENTVICPGHGPPSTVGFEKKHNPFFA